MSRNMRTNPDPTGISVKVDIEDPTVIEVVASEGEIEDMLTSKKNKDFTPHSEEVHAAAKRMYMEHYKYKDIFTTLNIPEGTLLGWIAKKGWAQERKDNDASLAGETLNSKKFKMDRVVDNLLEAINQTVEKAIKNGCAVKDLPALTAAAGQIEKLNRLTKGEATSISEERSKRATINFSTPQNSGPSKPDPFLITEGASDGEPDGSTTT